MGQNVNYLLGNQSQLLGADPETYRQQLIQAKQARINAMPVQNQVGAQLGNLLGRGLTNVAQDRIFFEVTNSSAFQYPPRCQVCPISWNLWICDLDVEIGNNSVGQLLGTCIGDRHTHSGFMPGQTVCNGNLLFSLVFDREEQERHPQHLSF